MVREGPPEEVTVKLRRMKGTGIRRVKRRGFQEEGEHHVQKPWGAKGVGMWWSWKEASVMRMEQGWSEEWETGPGIQGLVVHGKGLGFAQSVMGNTYKV